VRIVVTGASGNVGTALLRRLDADPEHRHEIVGVVRRPPPAEPPYDTATWVAADLADLQVGPHLDAAMAGADAVVHLAWGFQPARDVDYLERVGVAGSRAVLRAADAAGVSHLVHMSSLGAYSPTTSDQRVGENWPTEGVPTLAYSRQKAAVERLLDDYETSGGSTLISRLRPGLVIQHDAGSSLLRYGLPGYLPAWLVRAIPVLPLDSSLRIQVVHADDVADAVVRLLDQRAGGAFNLAAEPTLGRREIARALRALPTPLPRAVLRQLAAATWRAHLHALDPGWLDLAFDSPLMDTTRARTELGWAPAVSATDALRGLVAGMAGGAGTSSPVLRPRRMSDLVRRAVADRGVGSRRVT
jgi:UDP-glucose 4-epimerase